MDEVRLAKGLISLSIPIVLVGGYARITEASAFAAVFLAVALWALHADTRGRP